MYRELILKLAQGNEWVKLQPPCPEAKIEAAEKTVGCRFPEELKDLLSELNGDRWLILSAEEIVKNVKLNREGFLPLFEADFSKEEYLDRVERFLFFAANGCGDFYCYRISAEGVIEERTIFLWEHEEIGEKCCWRSVAGNMTEFLTRYYRGEI